jgi:hypothetical protein
MSSAQRVKKKGYRSLASFEALFIYHQGIKRYIFEACWTGDRSNLTESADGVFIIPHGLGAGAFLPLLQNLISVLFFFYSYR